MKRILLIGSNGQVGWELQSTLAPLGAVQALDQPEIDLAQPDALRAFVHAVAPDLIVNAAAYTAVDQAEREPEIARAVNAVAPGVLAEEARRLGAGLVHYSTDFVFDGALQRPYVEEDEPKPLSVYGRTKLEGDQAVQAVGGAHLILRVAWVYGLRGRNFLLTIRRLARERGALRVVNDQVGCPTWSRLIAEASATVLAQVVGPQASLRLEEISGLYHCACGGATSWYGFARAALPASIPIEPIGTADYPTPAQRPTYSALDCRKLERVFGVRLPSWDEGLQQALASEKA